MGTLALSLSVEAGYWMNFKHVIYSTWVCPVFFNLAFFEAESNHQQYIHCHAAFSMRGLSSCLCAVYVLIASSHTDCCGVSRVFSRCKATSAVPRMGSCTINTSATSATILGMLRSCRFCLCS